MNWILFAFALELGAIRGPDIPVDLSSYVQMESTAIIAEHLEIGGTLRSYQIPDAANSWWPYRMDYTVAATVRFGALSFGVEHLCYHTVDPWQAHRFAPVDGGYERAFVRITTPGAE